MPLYFLKQQLLQTLARHVRRQWIHLNNLHLATLQMARARPQTVQTQSTKKDHQNCTTFSTSIAKPNVHHRTARSPSPQIHPRHSRPPRPMSVLPLHLLSSANRSRSVVILVLSSAMGSPGTTKSSSTDSSAV